MNVIETAGVGKRYGRSWALRDCSLAIPAGRVVALVGPNGAGKSTLLNLAVGLTHPSAGRIAVLDGQRPGSDTALERIAFVAQDTPCTRDSAWPTALVAHLNRRFDVAAALHPAGRPGHPDGPQDRQALRRHALSGRPGGGTRRRHPELLILDEPVARLDPLARHDFMAMLMSAVAEEGLLFLLSSHVVAELQRVCDYVVLLAAGQVQLMGDVDDVVAGHHILTGPVADADQVAAKLSVVRDSRTDRLATLLVRMSDTANASAPAWEVSATNLEEVVLAYLRSPGASALPGPSLTTARSA